MHGQSNKSLLSLATLLTGNDEATRGLMQMMLLIVLTSDYYNARSDDGGWMMEKRVRVIIMNF